MHILHVVQLYKPVPSGAARYFVEIGERLVREGHQVTVLTTDAFDLEYFWNADRQRIDVPQEEHNGVKVVRFPVQWLWGPSLLYQVIRRLILELGRLPFPSFLRLPILYRLAQCTPQLPTLRCYLDTEPLLQDVALVHTTNITLDFMIIPVLEWAERRNIPHICTPFVHLGEPGSRYVSRYYSMPHQIDLLKRSAAVVTQTDLERSFLQSAGVPNDRMHTIGVGVTPDELEGGDGQRFRQEHNITNMVVLSMGTAAFDKGTIHTLQAMQQLWAEGMAVTWVQIGPLMVHFEQFFAHLPLEDQERTRLLGFVSDQTRLDALATADLFVLPSRTDSFGIVYLEAWCYGVPVIGAKAGGVPEVIEQDRTGLLVDFGDVDALAEAIRRLLQNQNLAQEMGQAGRANVHAELTWDRKYAQVRALYRQFTGE